MSVLMEFAMFPTDKGDSVSKYVSRIIKLIDENNYNYKLTPMGTIVEFDEFEQATELLNKAYRELSEDSLRIYSTITFDIRKGKENRMTQKIESIENNIGKVST